MCVDYLRSRTGACAIVVIWIAALPGCGGNPANYPDTAPVTGIVTLDGQPLEGATVSFRPVEGRSSNSKTDAAGKYELRYVGPVKGAMLGTHRVIIRKEIPDPNYIQPAEDKAEGFEPTPDLINSLPDRYAGRDSELSAEVKDGENVFDFQLTSE